MCDNYLLLFLWLRTLDNNSHRDVNIPWKKTTQFIRSFFYRNRISNGNNYLDENDILKCVNSHKNKQVLNNVGKINCIDSHLDDSPVNIYTSKSPSTTALSPNLGLFILTNCFLLLFIFFKPKFLNLYLKPFFSNKKKSESPET